MKNKKDERISIIISVVAGVVFPTIMLLYGVVTMADKKNNIENIETNVDESYTETSDCTMKKTEDTVAAEDKEEDINEPDCKSNTSGKTLVIMNEHDYSEDDVFCLSATIYHEAIGTSEYEMLMVGNVILNRVESEIYPDTIREVVTQYKQYGVLWRCGVYFPNENDAEGIQLCNDIAKRLLDGERVCPENVLFQAEFVQGSGLHEHIGKFYFCYY